jgi:hypothetical protein
MTSPCNGSQELKRREQIRDETVEIVNRETRAWDTKDVALLISVFHTDMVWAVARNSSVARSDGLGDGHGPL